MDMRTKLVFALVSVALGSMLALGAMTYRDARRLLTAETVEQLDGLADAKKETLEVLISGWQDRVSLIASRTQLRMSLRDYQATGRLTSLTRIRGILSDALRPVGSIVSLVVYDSQGRSVAVVERDPTPAHSPPDLSVLPDPDDRVAFVGTTFSARGEPHVSFAARLSLDDELLGFLLVELRAPEVVAVTSDTAALGESGETLIVGRDESGAARILHPVRHRSADGSEPVQPVGPADPAGLALAGQEGQYREGMIDYRGEPVWVATRYLPDTQWGLVVKFDAEEQRAPILQFRQDLTKLGVSLGAFAILLGVLLGFRFAKPIHELAEVADRIRGGELHARASEAREDEIGLFARTFNQMTEELEQRVTQLHEYQKFFDASRDMLCIAGTDGYFKRVNPAFERTLGWQEEELLSRQFFDFIHPEDVEKTSREIEKLAEGIPTISFENRYRCADGSFKHLLWTSHPEPETGLLYAIARDVTELKELRARS